MKPLTTIVKNNYNILVVNALNGSLALAARRRWPDARIVCAEYFPYFKRHLKNLGFEVMDWKYIEDNNMKFDAVVGNPPFQEITSTGERKDQASNLWTKFWHKAFAVTDDSAIIALITPTSWLSPSADFKGSDNYINGHDRLWNVFDSYSSHANVTDVAQHFPGIGSSFGYVIVDKSQRTGLKFSDASPTNLGFLPKSNINSVRQQLHPEKNLGAHFRINQDNSNNLRVSIPMTRTLTADSIEILSGLTQPTTGSDRPELYLYIHVATSEQAQAVRQRVIDCLQILNSDCKWSGFVNIQIVKMIAYQPIDVGNNT